MAENATEAAAILSLPVCTNLRLPVVFDSSVSLSRSLSLSLRHCLSITQFVRLSVSLCIDIG